MGRARYTKFRTLPTLLQLDDCLYALQPSIPHLTRSARHRWRVEGVHGTAKTLHGIARAIRRELENIKIQALPTAIAVNLKKLAAAVILLLCTAMEIRAARTIPTAG